jgi:hypothetical protein
MTNKESREMAGKRAPGGGRKPMGEFQGKTETLTTRITPAVRSGLEREAARSGRSLSQEVEKRLEASLQAPQKDLKVWGPPHVCLLARLVSKMTTAIESSAHKRWHEDQFTAETVRSAAEMLIMRLAPGGSPQTPPELERMAREIEERSPDLVDVAETYRDPRRLGVSIALGIVDTHMLYDYPAADHPPNEHYSDNFYLMPKIREILGPKKSNKRS